MKIHVTTSLPAIECKYCSIKNNAVILYGFDMSFGLLEMCGNLAVKVLG
jgi:hypothetical protein